MNVSVSRRGLLQQGSVAALTAGLSATFSAKAYAAGDDTLKLGLVGCGGRGTGATREALQADPGTKLIAVADVFPKQMDYSLANLRGEKAIAERVTVDDSKRYVGLEGYKQVIADCDVVVLASPPGFRPYHIRAAVEAGKHVFTEKPMATDAPGVRSVMESVKIAKEKKLAMVAGFCWRYDHARRALFEKIHAGEIGDVQAVYGTYLTGPVKPMPPASERPEGITDVEWMVRNWYNFTWLSGDGLVEQAVHTVDWLQWAMKDAPPTQCTAVGGRQIPAAGGNIFDHIEVNYEWGDTRGFLAQRQIPGCANENNLTVYGTKGVGQIVPRGVLITGERAWKYDGPRNNMYQTEHDELFASIRKGTPINDGDRMVTSTLTAIMGRMAGYTGQRVTWEMAMNSQELLVPELKDWSADFKTPGMAMPGLTPFV